jgi:GNAT superfamily N-acetyltransferase
LRVIRPAVSADLAYLQAIECAAATLFPAGRIPDVDDVMPLGELGQALDAGLLWVAVSEAAVVGFAMAQECGDALHLAVMAVHPDHGARGHGRSLVLALCDAALRRHASSITLTTFADVPFNGPFYRKQGFQPVANAQLSHRLRALLEHETALGMANRIAMQWHRQPDPSMVPCSMLPFP